MPFTPIPEALELFRQGEMLVVVDDEDRENEGDLTLAAEKVTPEAINFMATYGRGLICLALTPERCDALELPPIAPRNTSRFGTAFCESIDAVEGVTTGISAADRARTILTAIHPDTRPEDLARPGHVFPLRARKGGVLVRAGQTEAAVDLARLAGLTPAGVICEIMNDDGSMARVPQLEEFCARHNLRMVSVADLIRYRLEREVFLERVAKGQLPTAWGTFTTIAYSSADNNDLHFALVYGNVAHADNVLVRMHSHCLYGDVFGSTQCDCRQLVEESLRRIAQEGRGVLVYLHATSPGVQISRLPGKEAVLDSHSRTRSNYRGADGERLLQMESGIGAQILSDLGLKRIRVLTNHPRKIAALPAFGIEVVGHEPLL